MIRTLVRQLEASHKGLTSSKKKEGLERVLLNFESDPEQLPVKLQALISSWGSGASPERASDDAEEEQPASAVGGEPAQGNAQDEEAAQADGHPAGIEPGEQIGPGERAREGAGEHPASPGKVDLSPEHGEAA